MNKILIATCIALAASTIFAAPKKTLTPEERAARQAKEEQEFLKETGGWITDRREMKGRVVYVNAQKSAKKEWMMEQQAYFDRTLKMNLTVEDGTFTFPDVKKVGEVTIFVIEDPKFPSILAAPDQGWAAVNVLPLKEGAGEKPQFFEARVKKELTRALVAAAGGIDSGYPRNVVGPVTTVSDLDKFADSRVAVDVIRRMDKLLTARGLTKYVVTTYDQACIEGWAPAPTNDYQKAVWEQNHKLPTNPIVIKPESQRK